MVTVVALLVGLLMATSAWHLTFSRYAIRGILDVFYGGLTVGLIFKSFNGQSRWPWAVLAGLVCGLGLYGYGTFKFLVFPLAFLALWARPKLARLALLTIVVVAVAAPLFHFIYTHSNSYFHRLGRINVTNHASPLVVFAENIASHLRMLLLEGDANMRHNMWPLPQLMPLVSLLALLGITQCGRVVFCRATKNPSTTPWLTPQAAIFVLIWLVVMFLPGSVTQESIPHAHRSIGLIYPMLLLAGIGGGVVWQGLSDTKTKSIIAIIALVFLSSLRFWQYFVVLDKYEANGMPDDFMQKMERMVKTPKNQEAVLMRFDETIKGVDHNLRTFKYLYQDQSNEKIDQYSTTSSQLAEKFANNPKLQVYGPMQFKKTIEALNIPEKQVHLYQLRMARPSKR